MIIEIYKCDYCTKDFEKDDLKKLFNRDACDECYGDYKYGLEKKLSNALFDFVDPKDKQIFSSVLNTCCDKCGATYSTANHIEHVSGRDVTAFSIPNISLSLSFDLCDKCSKKIYKIFKQIAADQLDLFRVKYKKKDIAKLTYINELFEYSYNKFN